MANGNGNGGQSQDQKKYMMYALFAFIGVVVCVMLAFGSFKLADYLKNKRESEEADETSTTPGAPPAPAPPTARDRLLAEGKLILGPETDINVVSPPSIPMPFTPTSDDKEIEYTISFDIKVEKNLPMDGVFIVLDRGGSADDSNGRRPLIQVKTTSRTTERCARNVSELQGLENTELSGVQLAQQDTAGCQKIREQVIDKTNFIEFFHKPSVSTGMDGPQAGQDYKNVTIIVRPGETDLRSKAELYYDGAKVTTSGTDQIEWGNLSSEWRWAGGQTAVNSAIGYVKIRNAYIFKRALDEEDEGEISLLLNKGASASNTSSYKIEPPQVSWKFDPEGFSAD